jgi:hypothetical protein
MIIFAWIYIVLTVFVAVFQLALIFGAPWGEYTLGGRYPGKLPANIRIAAVVQIFILVFFAVIVMARSGLAFSGIDNLGRIGIWFVVAFFVLGTVMNLSSPSKKEKMVMGPLNVTALASTTIIALA